MSDDNSSLAKRPIAYSEFIDFIVEKNVKPECPSCGNLTAFVNSEDDETVAAQTRMDVVAFDPVTRLPNKRSGTSVLALSVVCENCGFIRSYASQTVYEWLNERQKKNSGSEE